MQHAMTLRCAGALVAAGFFFAARPADAQYTAGGSCGATGANAAGTEIVGKGTRVEANSSYNWYPDLKVTSTDFFVGGSDTATALTILIMGRQHVV